MFVVIFIIDIEVEIDWIVCKCLDLCLFFDLDSNNNFWEKFVKDIDGELLIVS